MTDQLARHVETVQVTDDQKTKLLKLMEQEPHLGHALALRRAGVAGTKGQLVAYIAEHPELVDDIDQARGKRIRTELLSRAIDGVEDPIVNKDGEISGYRTVRSDRLLEFAARMYLPEARALQAQRLGIEVGGADGGPIRVEVEGDRVSTVSGVLALAVALGVKGAPAGLNIGSDRRALPPAQSLLPDPPVDQ